MKKSAKGKITPAVLALRAKRKGLARIGLDTTATLERRQSAGEFGVEMRHDLEMIRDLYENITDDREYLPHFSDWELDELASHLLSELIALEQRFAAGRVQ